MAPTIPSRLYVELIFKRMNKCASWEPSRPIRLGDHGHVDKKSGDFMVVGNLYHEGLVVGICPPKVCAAEEELRVESHSVKSLDFGPDIGVDLTGLLECNVKGRWKFGKRPSAVLLLVKPVLSYIERAHELAPIMSIPRLCDCAIVTELYSCPAFALGMENKTESDFSLGFHVTVPPGLIPAAPLVQPEGGILGEWMQHGHVSVLRKGVGKPGEHYVPLFRLMALTPKYKAVERLVMRGPAQEVVELPLKPGNVPEDAMVKCLPPWGALDNDGESEEDEI